MKIILGKKGWCPYRRMTMLTDIHLCKRASITHTDHVHSKVSEKIYDL